MMGTVFTLIVISNIAFIRYAVVIPLSLYLLVASTSAADLIIVNVILPLVSECHQRTDKLLLERKKSLVQRNLSQGGTLRIARMDLRALKPISVTCGGSFKLKNSTNSAFYDQIIQATMNGVLMQ